MKINGDKDMNRNDIGKLVRVLIDHNNYKLIDEEKCSDKG